MIVDPNFVNTPKYDFKIGNMVLAEDQLLSYEIITRKNSCYITKYIPDAVVYTDSIKTLPTLMKQRKRWINGSLLGMQKKNM